MIRIPFACMFVLATCAWANAGAIHDAAEKGDAATLFSILDGGADINESDGIAAPLYYAILNGHLDAAKLLIARGADPNFSARWGPPLMAAAKTGDPESFRLLLDAGANAAVVFKGQTALEAVAHNGCLDCAKALVESGADVNALNSWRQPPVHFAVKYGHKELAGYLLSQGYAWPAPPPVATMLAKADARKGEALFLKTCRKCHFSDADGGSFAGPNLWDVVGRPRASITGYKYSAALLAAGGEWTYENLNVFISDPARALPGVEMSFEGIQDDAGRADIIAFLRTRSGNPLPLP